VDVSIAWGETNVDSGGTEPSPSKNMDRKEVERNVRKGIRAMTSRFGQLY